MTKEAIMKARSGQSSPQGSQGGEQVQNKPVQRRKKKKENTYHHVSIIKLQGAFEQQFFTNIFTDGELAAGV